MTAKKTKTPLDFIKQIKEVKFKTHALKAKRVQSITTIFAEI